MPRTLTPYLCFLAINHGPNGWSEGWHLRATSLAEARADVAELAAARALLLADDCVLEWASVRSLYGRRFEWAAINNPLEAPGIWGPNNSDVDSLLWRFEDGNGHYGNHHFRAVPDTEIEDGRFARGRLRIPPGPQPHPADLEEPEPEDYYRYVLALFRDLCCHAIEFPPNDEGQVWWQLDEWQEVIFRKVSKMPFASAYRRVSWEAVDWTQSPPFSPCGTAVTVLRTGYSNECTFTVDGPQQEISYFWAPPGAAVLPFPTIFFGPYRDKDYDYDADLGEPHRAVRADYSLGLSWSDPPGLAPDGNARDFMGLTVSPWGDDPETPPLYRIECAMPTPVPIRVDDNPETVVDANVTWITIDGETMALEQIAPGHVQISAQIPAAEGPFAVDVGLNDGDTLVTDVTKILFQVEDGAQLEDDAGAQLTVGFGGGWPDVEALAGDVLTLDPAGKKTKAVAPAAGAALHGIAAGYAGQPLRLINAGNQILVIVHASLETGGENEIFLPGNADWPLVPGAALELSYDPDAAAWRAFAGVVSADVYTEPPENYLARYVGPDALTPGQVLWRGTVADDAAGLRLEQGLALALALDAGVDGFLLDPAAATVQAPAVAGGDFFGASTRKPGTLITLRNPDAAELVLRHQVPLAAPLTRFTCPQGRDVVLKQHESTLLSYTAIAGDRYGWWVHFAPGDEDRRPAVARAWPHAGCGAGARLAYSTAHSHYFGLRSGSGSGGRLGVETAHGHFFSLRSGVDSGGRLELFAGDEYRAALRSGSGSGGRLAYSTAHEHAFALRSGARPGSRISALTPPPHYFGLKSGCLAGGDVEGGYFTEHVFEIEAGAETGGEIELQRLTVVDLVAGAETGGDVEGGHYTVYAFDLEAGAETGGDVAVDTGGGGFAEFYHWPFTDGSGTSVTETVAGNHGAFSGSPTGWSSDHPTSGFSVEFDGNGGIQASSMVNTSSGNDFTISMWIKIKSLPGHVWCTGDGFGGNVVNSRVLNDPPVKMSFENGGTSVFKTIASPVGGWHHFAWVQDGAASAMYLDGSIVDTTFNVNEAATGGGIMFGKNFAGGFPLNGWITDVRIWNSALDAATIAAVYADI